MLYYYWSSQNRKCQNFVSVFPTEIINAVLYLCCVGQTKTEMPGVVSVFPNTKRSLHTTHSWDFMGLINEETMEIPGYSTKNQVNVIIGFIDTGDFSVPFVERLLTTLIK